MLFFIKLISRVILIRNDERWQQSWTIQCIFHPYFIPRILLPHNRSRRSTSVGFLSFKNTLQKCPFIVYGKWNKRLIWFRIGTAPAEPERYWLFFPQQSDRYWCASLAHSRLLYIRLTADANTYEWSISIATLPSKDHPREYNSKRKNNKKRYTPCWYTKYDLIFALSPQKHQLYKSNYAYLWWW